MTRLQLVLVATSVAFHLGAWAWMGLLPKEKKVDAVAIALAEKKKQDEAKKPPPPPPPPRPPPQQKPAKAKAVAPTKAAQAEPAPPPVKLPPIGDSSSALDGFADLGVAVGNGDGVPVPTAARPAAAAPTASHAAAPVVKRLTRPADECTEDPVKPQLQNQVQPAYTLEGRQASVEGVVKLELSIDASGHVENARVVRGLGYGLDQAAVAAARQWTFKPATRCGKPVPYVVKPAVRFQLGS